ncbi:hypothetical protein MARBORIA2_14650 [Methanobrevibacter arboriphilus]|jgi:hypothetical protein|uniref:KTSC domain-containing protein n=1 Tax=Methanobrevibacter arboriphilus TaxID=39441 RepID=UPI0022EE16B3|nr:KTSC domain-containing protein [Methanobrevibacter arboriphilus]GLI12375.1 hypothetical protein MARBORIA2_14650 [Methanobrevibacter arboriphilus]
MQKVISSDLESVGYRSSVQKLHIKFYRGGIYEYTGVPQEIHAGLMNASSKGSYFHENIEDKYPGRKLL